MNIDLGVEALAPQLTGIGRYTLELWRGLKTHGNIQDLRAIYNGILADDPEGIVRGVIPSGRKLRPHQRWLEKAKSVFAGPRLYHGPNFMLPPKQDGVITVHDLSVFKFPETHPIERIAHFEKNFKRSLDQAVHIVTDTYQVRQELIEFAGISGNRITAVHLGVAPTYKPNLECGKLASYGISISQYILLVATFEPRKRIDAALRAYHMLPDATKRNFPLVLAGATGWRNDDLHDLMSRDEAKGYVRFLGFVPEHDLPDIYRGAKLFLYPSIYEGFGLPPIEAMASGVPVIVSNRSCLPEVTSGAGMLIDPDDIEGFAAAIVKGLEDNQWRAAAIARGVQVASGYTWAQCVDKTIEVYRSCSA